MYENEAETRANRRSQGDRRMTDTLATAFEDYAREHLQSLRTGRSGQALVEKHVLPMLGSKLLNDISGDDWNGLLRALAKSAPTLVRPVRSQLNAFFKWLETEDPPQGSAYAARKQSHRPKPQRRVLSDIDVRSIWSACGRMGASGHAVRFALTTGQHPSEVGRMEWSEIDLIEKVWIISPERSLSTQRDVPLSALAMLILAETPIVSDYVFAIEGRRGRKRANGGPWTLPSMPKARTDINKLRDAELNTTANNRVGNREWHLKDLRFTCAFHLERLGVEPLVIARTLNLAANREHMFDASDRAARRRALDLWGALLAEIVSYPIPNNVVPLPNRKRTSTRSNRAENDG